MAAAAEKFFRRLAFLGGGIAIAGSAVNTALYNGKTFDLTRFVIVSCITWLDK